MVLIRVQPLNPRVMRLRCCDSSIQLLIVFAIFRVLGSTVFLFSVAASSVFWFRLTIFIAFMIAQDRCNSSATSSAQLL